MIKWTVICQMLPDRDGKRKLRMHSELWDKEQDALDYQTTARHQNLPFSCWPIAVDLTGVPLKAEASE